MEGPAEVLQNEIVPCFVSWSKQAHCIAVKCSSSPQYPSLVAPMALPAVPATCEYSTCIGKLTLKEDRDGYPTLTCEMAGHHRYWLCMVDNAVGWERNSRGRKHLKAWFRNEVVSYVLTFSVCVSMPHLPTLSP